MGFLYLYIHIPDSSIPRRSINHSIRSYPWKISNMFKIIIKNIPSITKIALKTYPWKLQELMSKIIFDFLQVYPRDLSPAFPSLAFPSIKKGLTIYYIYSSIIFLNIRKSVPVTNFLKKCISENRSVSGDRTI